MAADKQHAHHLIDRLDPTQLPTAIGMLESLLDPVSRAIANAPLDDEPLSAAGEKALDDAREWSLHHQAIPHEDVLTKQQFKLEAKGCSSYSSGAHSKGNNFPASSPFNLTPIS
jgi:hypothetical protein